MSVNNPAKQFMPFSALTGFDDYLREKEIVKVKRKELSEDNLEELERNIKNLDVGYNCKIVHYINGRYIETLGKISKIDYIDKMIILNGTYKIKVNDIVGLDIIDCI